MREYVVNKLYVNNNVIYILEDKNRIIVYNPYTMDRVFTTLNRLNDGISQVNKKFEYELSLYDFSLSTLKIIISTACNFRCDYCTLYKNHKEVPIVNMNKEQANKIIDFYKKNIKQGVVLFTGGEPLVNWNVVEHFLNNMNAKFIIQTNGSLLNRKISKTLNKKNVLILLSLDGHEFKQNASRKFIDGEPAHDSILRGYISAKSIGCSIGISILADNSNVNELFNITKKLKIDLQADSFGYNIPHFTKYNDSDVNIEAYTEQLIKIFHFAKKEQVYIDQIARKLKPLLYKTFRVMDCSAAGEAIIFFPDGSTTNCVNYPPFSEQYDVKRWKNRVPLYNDFCKDCISIGMCGGGCYYDGITRFSEGIDLRNCYYTKKMTQVFLWDFYDEMELSGFDEVKLRKSYDGILGFERIAGVSAGHESRKLSTEILKTKLELNKT